jgi:transposase-like protein
MAHPEHTKAQALALLLLGESVADVVRVCRVPRRTVRRWRAELPSYIDALGLRETIGDPLREARRLLQQNGPEKRL